MKLVDYLQIIAAESSDMADEWISAIRSVAALYAPPPEDGKGPTKVSFQVHLFLKYNCGDIL